MNLSIKKWGVNTFANTNDNEYNYYFKGKYHFNLIESVLVQFNS